MKQLMQKSLFASMLLAAAQLFGGIAHADTITTSAACPGDGTCDTTVTDQYSYLVTAETGGTLAANQIQVTVENTSPDVPPEALIEQFWFNLALATGDAVTFSDVSTGWTVTTASGGAQFDYTGDSDAPGDRLGRGDSMMFTINFTDGGGSDVDAYLAALSGAASDLGKGIGGGEDSGQFCAHFQQLGADGQDSDLLCSTWGDTPPNGVPEPGTLALLGIGLVGLGMTRRRRRIQ